MRRPFLRGLGAVCGTVLLMHAPLRAQIPPGVPGGIVGGSLASANMFGPRNGVYAASMYMADSGAFRPEAFRKLALKLGFRELPGDSDAPCFEYRDAIRWQARTCLELSGVSSYADDTIAVAPWLSGDSMPIAQDRIFGRLTISALAHDNPGRPLAHWLLSAYLRELHPDRPLDTAFYLEPERKSLAGYRWRNTLSMGWGTQYASFRNPFLGQAGLAAVCGYLMDALTLPLIVGGPFLGESRTQKIGLTALGLGVGAFFRIVIFNSGNIQPSFALLDSGYPMPRVAEEPEKIMARGRWPR